MPMSATRLHHTAYVTKDLQATRRFYEELLGFPLQATWCEADELFGKLRVYCHCFFGLEDGSALAFFQFAEPSDQAEFGPPIPSSPAMPAKRGAAPTPTPPITPAWTSRCSRRWR